MVMRSYPVSSDSDIEDQPHYDFDIFGIPVHVRVVPCGLVKSVITAIRSDPSLHPYSFSRALEAAHRRDPLSTLRFNDLLKSTRKMSSELDSVYVDAAMSFLCAAFPGRSEPSLKAALLENLWLHRAFGKLAPETPDRPSLSRVIEIHSLLVSIELMNIHEDELEAMTARCECCFDEYRIAEMLICPANHRICNTCLQTHVEAVTSDGSCIIPCWNFGCVSQLPIRLLQGHITTKLIKILVQMEFDALEATETSKEFVRFWYCHYSDVFYGTGVYMCPECGERTCSSCWKSAHEGKCEDQPAPLAIPGSMEGSVSDCPKCGIQFIKEDGCCNKVSCPHCHAMFCYRCRKVLPQDIGYRHFWLGPQNCPPDMCPLWEAESRHKLVEEQDDD
jgi:hypothetical protein